MASVRRARQALKPRRVGRRTTLSRSCRARLSGRLGATRGQDQNTDQHTGEDQADGECEPVFLNQAASGLRIKLVGLLEFRVLLLLRLTPVLQDFFALV